jgi:hypothetical protein
LNNTKLFRALDENNIIVAFTSSLNGLASILGLSIAGVKYHLNRESTVKAKSLDLLVSISQEGVEPSGFPIENYKSKKITRETLVLNNISLDSLEDKKLFAYDLEKKRIFTSQPTAPALFKNLNPKISLHLDNREVKSKSYNMATYINKESIYFTELGEFYLAKNPNYSINAKIPIIVIDINLNIALFYNSKRDCARALSEILKTNIQLLTFSKYDWIDSGKIIQNKLNLVTKPQILSLIPTAVKFNSGKLKLTPYKFNFINHKYPSDS